MTNQSVIPCDSGAHNVLPKKVVEKADEIISAASRAIENQNDRDVDIHVELSDYHRGGLDREFEKTYRIEYVGPITEEDKSNVMYMWARSEAAKRRFDNVELDYRAVLDDPGMKKLSVVLRKSKKLPYCYPPLNFDDNYMTSRPPSYEQDHQYIRDPPELSVETFQKDDDHISNERPCLSASKTVKHRQRVKYFAKEPEVYASQVKKCPRCLSVNVKFKYLNNKKLNQPRYLCLSCNNQFTHGGKVVPERSGLTTSLGGLAAGFHGGKTRFTGKTRKRKAQEPERFVCLKKECPNCHSEVAEFKYLNNRKEDQPRYKCMNCKQLYQFPSKRTRLTDAEKVDTPLNVPVCELAEQGSTVDPSAVVEGNEIVIESSTLHLEQDSKPFKAERSRLDQIEE